MITNNVNPNNGLTGFTLNARSVRNKTADIFDVICESKADLIAITETWFTKNDSAVKVELCPIGYKIVDHPRTGRTGGGTALIFRDTLNVKKVDGGQKDSFEFSEWIVTSSPHNARIFIVYRPPYSEDHKVSTSVFFDEFSDCLKSLLLCKEQLLITGDFNIHTDKGHQDPISSIFLNLLESFNLQQHVTMPTHLHGHILDLIITRMSKNLYMDHLKLIATSLNMLPFYAGHHHTNLTFLLRPSPTES